MPAGFPAVPDFELTLALINAGKDLAVEKGFTVHSGINATDDAFYAETPEWIAQMENMGLTNVEME